MSFEIDDDRPPYTAVVFIEARFGQVWGGGSGFIVGRNDVLTASHVIYNAVLGGLADEIRVYPSYDPDATDNVFFHAVADRYFNDFDPDADTAILPGDNKAPSFAGSERDIALLALSEEVTGRFGSFAIGARFEAGPVEVVGYPARYGKQPIYDSGTAVASPVDAVLRFNPDVEINVGNSGGPIFQDDGVMASAVAVVSSGVAGVLIAPHLTWIRQAMADNDQLLGSDGQFAAGTVFRLIGTEGPDLLPGSRATDSMEGQDGADTLIGFEGEDILLGGWGDDWLVGGPGRDGLDGGEGTDTAWFSGPRANYVLTPIEGAPISSRLLIQSVDGADDADLLVSVERLRFTDGLLALDVTLPGAGSSHAGTVYRLYEAAFNRAPESEGLGFWISQLDRSLPTLEMARAMVTSPEFQRTYDARLSPEQLVSRLYQNILDRAPEPAGMSFWSAVVTPSRSNLADVVLAFANSAENQSAVIATIGQGIWIPGDVLA